MKFVVISLLNYQDLLLDNKLTKNLRIYLFVLLPKNVMYSYMKTLFLSAKFYRNLNLTALHSLHIFYSTCWTSVIKLMENGVYGRIYSCKVAVGEDYYRLLISQTGGRTKLRLRRQQSRRQYTYEARRPASQQRSTVAIRSLLLRLTSSSVKRADNRCVNYGYLCRAVVFVRLPETKTSCFRSVSVHRILILRLIACVDVGVIATS